jgi:hypothetical protein
MRGRRHPVWNQSLAALDATRKGSQTPLRVGHIEQE